MRIQHNILAMNAYRNYNTNTKALAGNLEKLSSGYKINRAGDDAAGLAISEKMRAQIKGLEAAQKNVKDGTSLVKTAEGAMQEIQDMLGRMKYLATQSANGTYDDAVDRKNLQAEVDQLRSEINRIADSANFNGIKLLNGKMGVNEAAFDISSTGAADATTIAGLFGQLPTAGDTKITNTILHTDATKGVKGSFTLDFSQIVKKADATTAGKVDVTVGGITTATITAADKDTDITGKTIAQDLIGATGALKGGIVIKADGTMVKADGYNAAVGDVLYETTSNGNDGTLTYNLTKICTTAGSFNTTIGNTDADLAKLSAIPDAAVNAHKLNFNVSVANNAAGTGALTGTENVAATNITATVKAEAGKLANFVIDVDVTKLQDGMKLKVGDKEVTVALGKDSAYKTATGNKLDLTDMEAADLSTKEVDVLDRMSAALSSNGYFTVGQTADNKLSFSETADGSGVSTVATAKQENLKSIEKIAALFSSEMPEANATTTIKITDNALKDGDSLTIDGKQYTFLKDPTKATGGATGIDIKNAAADLATALTNAGLTASNNNGTITIESATFDDGPIKVVGKGLQLQIGDTSENYNQLGVQIGDMHTGVVGLNIDGVDITNAEGASESIQTIMNAINSVSSTRGTLGALQNRLDHTANNLSVMAENIQDAESTIRDTDVAEEMMAYTKNNILVQSAQAMLAQANAVPQGVLQLLG